MTKYVIMPITAPIADVMCSSIVNSVTTLPKSLDGTLVCVPFEDTDNTDSFTYSVLSYTEWGDLQVTPEWNDQVTP